MARIDFVLVNSNDFDVKDPVVACDFIGNSGTVVSRKEATVFEVVPANGQKQVRDVSYGFIRDQTRSVRCEAVHVLRR